MAKFIVIAKSGKLRVKSFNDAPDNLVSGSLAIDKPTKE